MSIDSIEKALSAVIQNGMTFEFVPDDLRTEKICLTAIKSSFYAFLYVPKIYKPKNSVLML